MIIRTLFLLQIGLFFCISPVIGFAGDKQIFNVKANEKINGNEVDSTKAIQTAIDAAIKAGPGSTVQLQKGKYRLSAVDLQPCLKIGHANGLIIQGQGENTELIITNPRCQAINLDYSKNTIIKSLVIDYDPLPYTQGRIIDVNAEDEYFDLDIEEGFPELDKPWFAAASEKNVAFGMLFDGNMPVIKANAPDHIFFKSWQKISGRVYRLNSRPDQKSKVAYIAKGDRFVLLARLAGGGAGIYFGDCERCGLEDVKIYASNSGAVIAVSCNELVFRRLEVKRRPNTNRLLSTDADGVHCQQNRVGPLIEDCLFEYIADDTLNIYCTVSRILESPNTSELILSQDCRLKSGDRLQIYNPREGRVLGERIIKALDELPGQRYRVQLDKSIEGILTGANHFEADTAFNLSASGQGYVIRNNRMIGQRRHGMLLRGGNGIIENNYIKDVRGLGIVLANDPDWPEGPIPGNIVIKNNTIVRVGDDFGYGHRVDSGAIQVINTRTGWNLGKGRDIRNIVIEGNKVIDPIGAAIFVGGARNVTILNNEITASEDSRIYEKRAAVRIANCEGVKIDGLSVVDPRPDCIAAVEILADTAADVNGVAITRLKAQLHTGAVQVIDNRK
ncbi:MAG: hypothetical protein A2Y12_10320 [Planctomycetes bacterium GWF2_42_9]|nr:MAG: hypothetical protein A2Y12_10320 [Planctomycetes bacterium GWF2_42_9]